MLYFGMVITSSDNPKIVQAAKLFQKKYRDRTGCYIIEGVRLVSDAIKHGAKVREIFVQESAANAIPFDDVTVVSDKVFSKLCETVNSQGVVAVVEKPERAFSPCGNSLILDGLQDPGNVGTLIRTAAACGFTDVFAANCVDLYSPKVIRSAMSAHFCVALHETDVESVFAALKGVPIVAADMHGDNLFETQLCQPVAVALGNEGNGLSQYVRDNVSKTVSLPMANDFESLNVAVAGSVIMYRIFSQNK